MNRQRVCSLVLFVCLLLAGTVSAEYNCDVNLMGDFNHDCCVNFADFAIFAQNWLTCNDPQNPVCTYTP
jgi:hypothetical protein